MSHGQTQAVFGRRFARNLWRLIRVYWTSPDARRGAPLLLGAIALEFGTVYASVRIAQAEGRIMDTLERKDAAAFFGAVGIFLGVTLAFLLTSTYRIYLRQALEIRWRHSLTAHYIGRWMSPRAYYLAELHRGAIDNPDQRIAEDVRDFVGSALGLSLSLLSALVTLVSFGGMLWVLSRGWAIQLGSVDLRTPGLVMWVAILFAGLSSWITHVVGRRLIPINFDKLRFEADFRYGLVRFRDSVEAVGLSRGEAVERHGALDRFRSVIRNWWQLIKAQRNLTLLTTGIGQVSALMPVAVAAPAYFAGHITLGAIVQVRYAYGQVSAGLTWFVSAYQEIARWRANVERLSTFAEVMDTTEQEIQAAGIRMVPGETGSLRLADLRLMGREGQVLLDQANATVSVGDRVAVTGPSGVGKTVLVRAIAGLWPFGAGRIELPARTAMLFVPQQPYFPMGSLRVVVSFPAPEGTFPDERIREVLRLLGLRNLEARLDQTQQWEQTLSPNEQQRLALVRVFLHEPEWLVLDKATSALDDETERRVYELLAQRLGHATVISVAHRPAVAEYHGRRWTLTMDEDGRVTFEAA